MKKVDQINRARLGKEYPLVDLAFFREIIDKYKRETGSSQMAVQINNRYVTFFSDKDLFVTLHETPKEEKCLICNTLRGRKIVFSIYDQLCNERIHNLGSNCFMSKVFQIKISQGNLTALENEIDRHSQSRKITEGTGREHLRTYAP